VQDKFVAKLFSDVFLHPEAEIHNVSVQEGKKPAMSGKGACCQVIQPKASSESQ